MRRIKKPKPFAVCDVCGAFTGEHQDVNHRCSKAVYGRRCAGRFKTSLGHVWDQCQACDASGEVGSEICVECSGWGWHLIG